MDLHGTMTIGLDEFPYPRAPILEAVFELRFSEVSLQKTSKAVREVRSRYDNQSDETIVEGNLDFQTKSAVFKDLGIRTKLSSSDQTDALHISGSNLVWLRLAPYEGWKPFYERIERELPKVLKALGHPTISRIGLRYVNRIDVPSIDGICYPEHYLSYRIVAGDILEPHDGFMWKIQKYFRDRNLKALVQSGMVNGELPQTAGVTFDIDISVPTDVPSQDRDILSKLCEMRQLKNEIFEGGITAKAREVFNG